jgi:4-amino-4-deoxy-L-arabinose transferase-like glycosyltransferase
MQHSTFQTAPRRGTLRLPRLVYSAKLWLTVLALQYALVQLVLGVQYGDAPRNLHWGLVVAENPAFLLHDVDPYERITGFVPDPPTLAPQGLARNEYSTYNVLWGPIPMLLMASVWWLTHSRLLVTLVVPAAAGATIVACYRLGLRLFDRRVAVLAAAFLAVFPLFYERAVVSYAEPISACFLLLSLAAYMRGRTLLAALCGLATILCKINMAPIYCGVIGCSLLYRLRYRRDLPSLRHSLVTLALPMLALMGWYWLRSGSPIPSTNNTFDLSQLQIQSLNMLQMLFYIPWYGALLTLAVIGVCAAGGLRSPRLGAEQRVILASWVVFGIVALVGYMATPGMDNSPRALLPSIPALALLFAEGWSRLPRAWARRAAFYLATLFVVVNVCVTYYSWEFVRYTRTFDGVWQVLREQPRGWVLTNMVWPTIWETRQPTTWFERDPQFQANILHDRANFVRYTSQHAIRYVVVPRAGTDAAVAKPFIQIDTIQLYSDDVVEYLQGQAQRVAIPPYYDLYILPSAPASASP